MPAHNFRDISGQRYGLLEVLWLHPERAGKKAQWTCLCACGRTTIVSGTHIRLGTVKSCGCLRDIKSAQRMLKHGRGRRGQCAEYAAWGAMKTRCTNEKIGSAKNYSGRGITVCDRWAESFEAFYLDMGPRPSPNHSIDRIDNDGPYSAENCRWATPTEQARNKRRALRFSFGGKTLHLMDWAKETGIAYGTLKRRLGLGWPIERALTEPTRKRGR